MKAAADLGNRRGSLRFLWRPHWIMVRFPIIIERIRQCLGGPWATITNILWVYHQLHNMWTVYEYFERKDGTGKGSTAKEGFNILMGRSSFDAHLT